MPENQDSILIVEDEQDIAELIKVHMEDQNLQVELCDNGLKAIELASDKRFSILILDINLPGCSGLDVCRKVREKKPEQAILSPPNRCAGRHHDTLGRTHSPRRVRQHAALLDLLR